MTNEAASRAGGNARFRAGALVAGCLVVLALSACAPGENPLVGTAPADGEPAGFLLGLWHGVIAPFTFVASLFTQSINVYEVHNVGAWYDFGFVLGAGVLLGGGGAGSSRRRRRY